VFEGGEAGVQHKPSIHIILWGPKSYWNEDPEGQSVTQTLEHFYQSLSGSPWQGILTQYYDYATHIGSTVTLAPTYLSTYNPNAIIDDNAVRAIIRDAIEAKKSDKSWAVTPDSQYVLVTPKVWAYNTNFMDTLGCAYHSWDYVKGESGAKFRFAFLPNYASSVLYDRCKKYSTVPLNILTTMASHEYAETATNAETGNSTNTWISHDTSGGGREVADVCSNGTENVGKEATGSLAGVYVSELWDNLTGGCNLSHLNPPFPSPEQPQPLVETSGKIDLFWRGADGRIEYSTSENEGKTWSNVGQFTSLGQPTAGQPSPVETSPGHLAVFWRSGQRDSGVPQCFGPTRDYLREMDYNGSSWSTTIPCHGSQEPIGPLGGDPQAVVQPNGTVDVLWRGIDNQLWYASRTGGVWSSSTPLGGTLTSDPSVVQVGSDRLDVFWRSTLGSVYHRQFTESTGTWLSPESVAGPFSAEAGPSALARSNGSVEVIWPSSWGLGRGRYSGGWQTDTIPGTGNLNSQFQPTVVVTPSGDAQAWYAATNGDMWTTTSAKESTTWSSGAVFASAGQGIAGTQPQAAVAPNGHPSVYWMDSNIAGAYAAWNNGSWHGPTLVSPLQPSAAAAKTGYASKGTESSAWVSGTVTPGRASTKYFFEYGPTTAYGSATSPGSSSSSFPVEVSQPIVNLTPGVTYHYRLVAENEFGPLSAGQDETFTAGWNIMTAEGSYLSGVSCTSTSQCMAVGYKGAAAFAELWNGTAWQEIAPSIPGSAVESQLTGVSCPTSTFCMAVGYYKNTEGKYLTLANRWKGSNWEPLTTPNKTASGEVFNFLNGVSCMSSNECVAAGDYLTRTAPGQSEVTKTIGEYWNGTNWTLQDLPIVSNSTRSELKGISCSGPSECTAVGYYASGPTEWAPLEGHWYGPSGWTSTALPNAPGAKGGWLYSVSCPTANYCAAVGAYGTGANTRAPLALRRNGPKGTAWEAKESKDQPPLPPGESQGYLYGVSCTASNDCTATGEYQGSFFGSKSLAEAWDGGKWLAQFPFNPSGKTETGLVNLNGVSCPHLGACSAVGFYLSGIGVTTAMSESYLIKVPPTVATSPATGITSSEAMLNGTVNPNGVKSSYYFEYGPTPSYGSSTTPVELGEGQSSIPVSRKIAGLSGNTTYHFRIVATNSAGTQKGSDQIFTTERSWSIQAPPSPEGAESSRLNGVGCPSDTSCTAVGEYKSSGVTEPISERWGESWEVMPMPKEFETASLAGTTCVTSSECFVVGYYRNGSGVDQALAERWTGSKWQKQSLPLPAGTTASVLKAVSCSPVGLCAAVGRYETSSKVKRLLVERWTGSSWELQTVPEPEGSETSELTGVSCTHFTYLGSQFDQCMAVGGYRRIFEEPFSVRWTGTKWEAQAIAKPQGAKEARLTAVSCPTTTNLPLLQCAAVGYSGSSGAYVPLAQKFNGVGWEVQSMPNPEGSLTTNMTGISCSSIGSCVAVGASEGKPGVLSMLAERWKESKWEIQFAPVPKEAKSTALSGVSCTLSGICMASGWYTNGSGVEVMLAERYS
jgi:hypothetical protein